MASKINRLGVLLTLAMVITLVSVLTHATPALSQETSTVGVSDLDEPAAGNTSKVGYTGTFHDEDSAVSFCNGHSNTGSYGFSVDENTSENTVVGTVAACGDPHRDSLTYSVGGTDVAKFNKVFDLNASTGEITVKSGASPNYEAYNSYSLTVTVTDTEDSSEATVPMNITVRNVDEPGIVTLSTSYPQEGVQVRASLYDPDGLLGGVFRSMWSRANVATGPFFLTKDEFERNNRKLYFTPNVDNRYKYLKFTIYYLDQTCPNVYSHSYVDRHGQLCLKRAEVVSENLVANADGLIIQLQTTNTPATGNVRITTYGVGIVHSLYGDVLNVQDEDGTQSLYAHLTRFSWQWFRIDPRTLAEERVRHPEHPTWNWTYVVQDADRGKGIQARVSFLDDRGTTETLRSAIQLIPAPPNNAATGIPVITGTAQVGEALTADTDGIQDADGIVTSTLIYQWFANDGTESTAIEDATSSTYTLVTDDGGKTITVKVVFSDEFGYTEALTSAPTVTVAPRQTSSQRSRRQNTPATGWPGITGTAFAGETLMATTNRIEDEDGLKRAVFTYQWLANDVEISDATDSSYTVTATDEGNPIQVTVTFSDDAGNEESLTSNPVMAATFNSIATGAPTISGTAQVGQILTASTSDISDSDGLDNANFTYQWISNDGTEDSHIQNATGSTYTVGADDEGKTIKVRVSFADDRSNHETVTSTATAAVTASPNSAATGAPTISGTAQVGQILTASTSDISDGDGLDNANFTYQWLSNDGTSDSNISGASSSTYTLVESDEGKTIKVRVTFTDDGGHQETVTSTATAAVTASPNSAATGAPTISGTAQVGQMLTASTSDISDSDGLDNANFTYQWLADDTDITDATGSTYTLAAADEGKTVKIRLSFTDDRGHQETLTSTATAAVTAAPSPLTVSVESAPTSHNGSEAFRIRVAFSETPESGFSYTTMRDDAFTVTGGDVTGARRLVSGKNLRWEVTVQPSGNADVTVELPVTTDCAAQGAICTDNDEKLSNSLNLTVSGPEATPPPAVVASALTVSVESAPTSHNGSNSFRIRIALSEAPKSGFSYTTMRDHAFTVTGGDVTGARRLVSGKNLRWEITVQPSGNADVTVELPITTDCAAQGAICTGNDDKLSNSLNLIVSGPN